MADDRSRLVENGGGGGGDEKEGGQLPPPSHLIVKVKEETVPEDKKKKVCEHCNKEFNGGKALGGHKRIHNPTPKPPKGHPHHPPEQQPPKRNKALYKPNQTIKFKNKEKQRLAPPTEINDDDDDDDDHDRGGIECPLCPRTFRSEKSMFGHLRCHPERYWRGSQPPSTYTSSPVPVAVSLSNNNRIRSSSKLTRSFKSWSITAKRGSNKGITISTASRKLIEEDKQLLEGAISFWLLMNGKTRPNDDDDIGSDPPPSTTSLQELIGDDDDECPTLNQLSSSEENKEQSNSDEDEDESSSKIISDSRNERLLITLKKNCNKEIQTKLVDFDSPPLSSPPLHHIHNHWGNHKKLEPVAVAPPNKTGGIINGNRLSATPSYRQSSGNQAVEDNGFDEEYLSYKYVCSVCGIRYPSHYGLGGHMSLHNKGKKSDKASASTSRKKSSISKLQHVNYQTAPQDIGGDVKPHWSNIVVPPSINNVARNDGAINCQGIGLPFLINNNVARRRNDGGELHSSRDVAININGINLNEAPKYEDGGETFDDDDDDSPGDSH